MIKLILTLCSMCSILLLMGCEKKSIASSDLMACNLSTGEDYATYEDSSFRLSFAYQDEVFTLMKQNKKSAFRYERASFEAGIQNINDMSLYRLRLVSDGKAIQLGEVNGECFDKFKSIIPSQITLKIS